jgi:RNA polymerase sigma-70 factor (ECF subfamily)
MGAIEADEFERQRSHLFALAYRMLGSASEAEDVVQDAWLRSSTAEAVDVRSPRAYLMTVVTRLALDRLKSARARREQYIGLWLPEPVLTDRPARAGGVGRAGRIVDARVHGAARYAVA